jgi:type IV secretory pathway VirB2 component (pilin)
MRIANMIKHTKQAFNIRPHQAAFRNSPTEREQQGKRLVKFVLASSVVCLIALEPTIAAATTGTGGATDNLTNAANSILGLMTGTLGKAVATIAVVVMGMMAMFGKLEWERAFKVILGIAIVFGAASIITLIGGTTTITGI